MVFRRSVESFLQNIQTDLYGASGIPAFAIWQPSSDPTASPSDSSRFSNNLSRWCSFHPLKVFFRILKQISMEHLPSLLLQSDSFHPIRSDSPSDSSRFSNHLSTWCSFHPLKVFFFRILKQISMEPLLLQSDSLHPIRLPIWLESILR